MSRVSVHNVVLRHDIDVEISGLSSDGQSANHKHETRNVFAVLRVCAITIWYGNLRVSDSTQLSQSISEYRTDALRVARVLSVRRSLTIFGLGHSSTFHIVNIMFIERNT